MAFNYDMSLSDNQGVMGDLRYIRGKFTNDGGSTGGLIKTGLQSVHGVIVTPTGVAPQGNAPTFDNTFPTTSGDVTIITIANANGDFLAYGR